MTDLEKLKAGLMALATASGHAGVVIEAMEDLEPEQTEDYQDLVAKAAEAGVKVDKRWGVERLAEEIAATEKE